MAYTSLLCILICTLSYVVNETAAAKLTVGIIGAGIGGRTTAAFLTELFGDDVEIHIYEPSSLGGRTVIATHEGLTFQTARQGFLHSSYRHLNNFVDKFGITAIPVDAKEKTAAFNGETLNVLSKESSKVNYGSDYDKLITFVEKGLKDFAKIYDLQNQNKAFDTVKDLLSAVSPSLFEYTKTSIAPVLKNDAGVGDSIINEYVNAEICAVNAKTVENTQGFAGLIALTQITGQFRSVKEGSVLLMNKLVEYAGAQIHRRFVQEVKKAGDKIVIVSTVAPKDKISTEATYDFVVVAVPINENMGHITFSGFEKPINSNGEFHVRSADLVKGSLNSEYFKSDPQTLNSLDRIINVKDDTFNTISRNYPLSGGSSEDKYYKISYSGQLEKNKYEIFEGPVTTLKTNTYFSSPKYSDFNQVGTASFVLSDNIYYVNAIEWASGGIEMTTIGAKNVALLIRNKVKK